MSGKNRVVDGQQPEMSWGVSGVSFWNLRSPGSFTRLTNPIDRNGSHRPSIDLYCTATTPATLETEMLNNHHPIRVFLGLGPPLIGKPKTGSDVSGLARAGNDPRFRGPKPDPSPNWLLAGWD